VKKIIIIQHEPLTKRTREIFYIDELLYVGFKIEYWNMSRYLYHGMSMPDEIKEEYCVEINSRSELQDKLSQIDKNNNLFIVEVFDCWKYRDFYRLLKQSGCFTIKMQLYATAVIPNDRIRRFIHENLSGKIRMINSYITQRMYVFYHLIYNFRSFDVEISSNPQLRCVQSVNINHPDYEKALEDNNKPSLVNGEYAVFLDEYYPLHPDIRHLIDIRLNETDSYNYLYLMCEFFDNVEKQFDIRIVIAAHPKSNYTNVDFGNRSVFKYKTAQLIRHANFVIMHGSAAVAYAVIFQRPLLGCYTEDYKKKTRTMYDFACNQNKIFGAPFIQVEKYINSTLPMPLIDIEKCYNFKYVYLTRKEIADKKNKDIITHCLKQL